MNRGAKLKRIYSDIKNIKIQGASNVARAAVLAYNLEPSEKNKRKLLSLRPTEPMLSNVLKVIGKIGEKRVLNHFDEAQDKINKNVLRVIRNKKKIFTHCHSSNVNKALKYAHKKRKKFEVLNTETRPLYQGRKTAIELSKARIKVTTFVDSAMDDAVGESDIVLMGADAILKDGVINKIGSDAIAKLASINKKPVYIVADSWKFSPKGVKIEERDFREVWKNAPKKVKVENPAFEKISKKYVGGIISELGILKYSDFVRRVSKRKF
jgi:translation initiation factor eIF-2B subunit delta